MELDDALRPLTCLETGTGGEWGGEEVMMAVEARGCGEEGGWDVTKGGEDEKTGSGLHKVIISDILASHKFLELWVRKMTTAPLRGPLGE